MAFISRQTTWSAGDKLSAAALEAEFDEIVDSLDGTNTRNVKVQYNSADIPNLELATTSGTQNLLRLTSTAASTVGIQAQMTGASAVVLVVENGGDKFDLKSSGVWESYVTTGTAPFIVASTTEVANLRAATATLADDSLDAQLLDGIDSSSFLRQDISDNFNTAFADIDFAIRGSVERYVQFDGGLHQVQVGRNATAAASSRALVLGNNDDTASAFCDLEAGDDQLYQINFIRNGGQQAYMRFNAGNSGITFGLDVSGAGEAIHLTETGVVSAGAGYFGSGAGATETVGASVGLEIGGTDKALLLSTMTTAQRDALTAETGMIIFNTTTGTVQDYNGSAWADI